jgi:hypothetical protein
MGSDMGERDMKNEGAAMELYQPMQSEVMVHRPPEKVLAEARQAAVALKDVVDHKSKPVKFNGEIYLEFEDLQTLARFYGITAKVRSTQFVQFDKVSGWEASAEAILVSSGQAISAADAMCLNDEPNWRSKPMFQLRSMAQTRACAKALRNVLAWVVVLAGYKPTPAEEMDGVIQESKPRSDPAPQQSASDDPRPKCPTCNGDTCFRPAGTTKTGKAYPAFWGCANFKGGCKGTVKDSDWQKQQGEPHDDGDPFAGREPGQEG